MTAPLDEFSSSLETSTTRPSMTVDWQAYAALLEETDATPEEQRELIETLWSIAVMFVAMGLDLHSNPQNCGQIEDAGTLPHAPDAITFFNRRSVAGKEER